MMAQAITIITEGRTPSLFHLFIGKLSKFTNWKKLNASNVLTATDSLRRCKYKKNLANNVHVSRIFLQKYAFFSKYALITAFFLEKQSNYFNVCIWTVPPVKIMYNWEDQSAIAVISIPQNTNRIANLFIIFLFLIVRHSFRLRR